MGVMLFVFTVIRMRVVGGMTTETWLLIGLVSYLMFSRTAAQVQGALNANKALFVYRQVKPVDTLLMRAALEGVMSVLIAIVIGIGGTFFGVELIPEEPLTVVIVFLGLWLMGLGYGLVTSVAAGLIPKVGIVLGIVSKVLHLSSGVILPLAHIPQPYRNWLLFNPVLHGIESARLAVSPTYVAMSGLDISYLYKCAAVAIFFGLALHRRFANKLLAL